MKRGHLHPLLTGKPENVRVHDFLIKELGRAVPYGIYDPAANTGFRQRWR